KPPWLRRRVPSGPAYEEIKSLIRGASLHTVCEEAHCPNMWECFSNRTATFLILGDACTRNCRFCAVAHGTPGPLDPAEPSRVARAAGEMGLRHVVVTSVTRDDLPDGGSGAFGDTVRAVRERVPDASVELLIPDLQGRTEDLETVIAARPDVLNHNLETVERLYSTVRPEAGYRRSLELLGRVREKAPDLPAKSGIMLGLGERPGEVRAALNDLLEAGCRRLTLGQYLQPSRRHLPVDRFVPPEEFEAWRGLALALGFEQVASGPFVRSSYRAGDLYRKGASGPAPNDAEMGLDGGRSGP
ncbi:MAG: lipoyl synthase, partial [Deltaproteobacteria bacterium]|nr:lipoyl synthase [Deltaproteobacteria bacterium]